MMDVHERGDRWRVARAGAIGLRSLLRSLLTGWTDKLATPGEVQARLWRDDARANIAMHEAYLVELANAGAWPILRAAYGEERSTIDAATIELQARRDSDRGWA